MRAPPSRQAPSASDGRSVSQGGTATRAPVETSIQSATTRLSRAGQRRAVRRKPGEGLVAEFVEGEFGDVPVHAASPLRPRPPDATAPAESRQRILGSSSAAPAYRRVALGW